MRSQTENWIQFEERAKFAVCRLDPGQIVTDLGGKSTQQGGGWVGGRVLERMLERIRMKAAVHSDKQQSFTF